MSQHTYLPTSPPGAIFVKTAILFGRKAAILFGRKAAICLAGRQPYFLAGILTLGFHDESRSQVDDSHDSGAKTLPQECIRDDEHAGKQIKEAIQVNKEITRRSRFHRFINPS